jgi:hypothetical protein
MKNIVHHIIENANNGTTPISFEAHTEPRMNKTNNPYFGRVIKVAFVGGLIGTNYEAGVNRQLEREGKEAIFKAKPRRWGVRDEEHRFIIHHKGEQYLSVKPQQLNGKTYYIDKETGVEIPLAELKPFLPKAAPTATQQAVGIEKEIPERDYKISSLRKIKIAGKIIHNI